MNWQTLLACIAIVIITPGNVRATALKVCNDTDLEWRVRVDGGRWQYFPPQPVAQRCNGDHRELNVGWRLIAEKVTRALYDVEFELLGPDREFRPVFRRHMQGNFRTNVAQLVDNGDVLELRLWWEFGMGGRCRDKPPLLGCRASCLVSHEDYARSSEERSRTPPRQPRDPDRH